jgi:hypothetical protein
VPSANGTKPQYPLFSSLGRDTTAREWDGRKYEKYQPQLAGLRGFHTYERMLDDPVLGGIMLAIEMLIRNTEFYSKPASEKPEDVEAWKFLEECREDTSHTWSEMVVDILTMLPHGWAILETTYKYRRGENEKRPLMSSKYDDGLIGWASHSLLGQDTLARFEHDSDVQLKTFVQRDPEGGEIPIPMQKCLHFRTRQNRQNPEGQSIMRKAYHGWYMKRQMQEVEGVGVERELAGLPVMTAPEGTSLWDAEDEEAQAQRREAQTLLKAVRENRAEGVLLPFGWDFELASTGGQRAIDVGAVIERYERFNAISMLGDFIVLGHESVGSFALADTKTNLFAYGIGAWLDVIVEVFNRHAVRRLFRLNQRFPQDRFPQIAHGDAEAPDLRALGDYISKLTGVGVLIPGEEIEDYARAAAGLPPRTAQQHGEQAYGLGAVVPPTTAEDEEKPPAITEGAEVKA